MSARNRRERSHCGDGPIVTSRNAATDVARAGGEVLDRDAEPLGVDDRGLVGGRLDELAVEERGDLAREPDHREEVDAVDRGRHVEHLLADRQHVVRAAIPGSSPSCEQHDPRVIDPRPTSSSARIIPRDTSPRSFASPSVSLADFESTVAPGSATATVAPGPEVPGAADDLLRDRPCRRRPGRAAADRRSDACSTASTRPTRK